MKPDLVSTIIPVHNRANLLEEAVGSVMAQTYRPIEIIIVDDGSTDKTSAKADDLQALQPDIVRVIHKDNAGPGAAREAGRQIAEGEFIQYLDSDDLLMPRKFELQVEALRKEPPCGVAYGATAYENNALGSVEYPWRRTGEQQEFMFPGFAADRWWGTSTPLYRRSTTDAAGAWLNLVNCEDWEYDCRVAAMKLPLAYVGEKVSLQRDHAPSRLSAGGTVDPVKLRDRSIAHEYIARHIGQGGLNETQPEVQQFGQLTFLLARQCGAAGLSRESQAMLALVRTICPETVAGTAKFRAYIMAGQCVGWTRVACWSDWRDQRNQRKRERASKR